MNKIHWAFQATILLVVIVSAYYVGEVILEKRAAKSLEKQEG